MISETLSLIKVLRKAGRWTTIAVVGVAAFVTPYVIYVVIAFVGAALGLWSIGDR